MKRFVVCMLLAILLTVCAQAADTLPANSVIQWNNSSPLARTYGLGTFFDALHSRPETLPLLGTLGVDKGGASDGVYLGSITKGGIGWFLTDDGGVFASDNVDMNSAGANDVALWPATPVADDAIYFGSTTKWCGATLNVGTAAGTLVMTTVCEYWNGAAWVALTLTLDETALMQPAGTGMKSFSFIPPANWTKKAVGGATGDTSFWVRFRVTAYTSKTTMPLLTQGWHTWIKPGMSGTGFKWPLFGTIKSLYWNCTTTSGSTADSKFLIINMTQGTFAAFTLTKATSCGNITGLNLQVNKDDQIVIKQIQEDASTEFANVTFFIKTYK